MRPLLVLAAWDKWLHEFEQIRDASGDDAPVDPAPNDMTNHEHDEGPQHSL